MNTGVRHGAAEFGDAGYGDAGFGDAGFGGAGFGGAGFGAVELDYAVVSDAGRRREINEDSAYAVQPCFLVADGMGGHEAGDLASQAAVAAFAIGPTPSTIVQKITGAIIIEISETNAVPMGFSCTATSGAVRPTRMPAPTATITAM